MRKREVSMKRIARFSIVLLFSLFCVGVSVIAEEITLTTYYPAPYGNYDELQATKFAVGSSATMPTTDGDMQVDGDLTTAGTIRANTAFNIGGTDGHAGPVTITVITDLQQIAGPVIQQKSVDITIEGGIVTNVTAETPAWSNINDVP